MLSNCHRPELKKQHPIISPVHIAFIGFGEAGKAFASGWSGNSGHVISAYDIKTTTPGADRLSKLDDYCTAGVNGCETPGEAVSGCHIVFSMVTADQVLAAARSVSDVLPAGCLYLDCNSCAPHTKQRAAAIVEAGAGLYVDAAIMAPVFPGLHRTAMLISGKAGKAALELMNRLGMTVHLTSERAGDASSIKMIRSIMMKGLEAVMAECVLAGRQAGVASEVLASLNQTYPGFDWPERADYMLERMMLHGNRRAAEMREVAATVDNLGLPAWMSAAAADWQDRIGALDLKDSGPGLEARADAILAQLGCDKREI